MSNKKLSYHDWLCYFASRWIKRHRQNMVLPNCNIVAVNCKTIESEIPDIIAWDCSTSILIEVKITRNDFYNDSKKSFRKDPEKGVGQFRYYLCPEGIISIDDLPPKWGLLYFKKSEIEIIKSAEMQVCNLQAEKNILISLIHK